MYKTYLNNTVLIVMTLIKKYAYYLYNLSMTFLS